MASSGFFVQLLFAAGPCSLVAGVPALAASGPWGASSLSQLSEEPRIEQRRAFISTADIFALKALARDGLDMEDVHPKRGVVSGGSEYAVLNLTAALEKSAVASDAAAWRAVQRLTSAAAAWAGRPEEAAEAAVLTRWDPWSPRMAGAFNRSGLLHLDARRQRWRRHTVLAYLSGSGSAKDGFTVFPCIETDDLEAKEVRRRQRLCERAARHVRLAHDMLLRICEGGLGLSPEGQYTYFEKHPELAALPREEADGSRAIDWQWTHAHDGAAAEAHPGGSARADALHALVEAMCRGEAPGLRVAPKAGDALLFEAAAPRTPRTPRRQQAQRRQRESGGQRGELVPDWRLWHAGCSPLRGHRWTAQVFVVDRVPGESSATRAAVGPQADNAKDASCSADA